MLLMQLKHVEHLKYEFLGKQMSIFDHHLKFSEHSLRPKRKSSLIKHIATKDLSAYERHNILNCFTLQIIF